MIPSYLQLQYIRRVLRNGGVIAYPTEGVYGLGCDPLNGDAVQYLLALKQRPQAKGLILIASDMTQLTPYLDELTPTQQQQLSASWPGPVTWVVPARPEVPLWLRGAHDTIAVRVTAHPIAAALCDAFGGALVSTSANISGRPAARNALAVRRIFGDSVDYVVAGATGGRKGPTEIRELLTGKQLRSA